MSTARSLSATECFLPCPLPQPAIAGSASLCHSQTTMLTISDHSFIHADLFHSRRRPCRYSRPQADSPYGYCPHLACHLSASSPPPATVVTRSRCSQLLQQLSASHTDAACIAVPRSQCCCALCTKFERVWGEVLCQLPETLTRSLLLVSC